MMKFLIAEDHQLLLMGTSNLLKNHYPDLAIEEAEYESQLFEQLSNNQFDLLIVDFNLGQIDPYQTIDQIREEYPDLPVIVMSMRREDTIGIVLYKMGVMGYFWKESKAQTLINVVDEVMSGRKYFSDETISKAGVLQQLSDNEIKVIKLICQGLTMKEVSARLNIKQTTVSTYKKRIHQKTNTNSDSELTRYAIEHYLIQSDL